MRVTPSSITFATTAPTRVMVTSDTRPPAIMNCEASDWGAERPNSFVNQLTWRLKAGHADNHALRSPNITLPARSGPPERPASRCDSAIVTDMQLTVPSRSHHRPPQSALPLGMDAFTVPNLHRRPIPRLLVGHSYLSIAPWQVNEQRSRRFPRVSRILTPSFFLSHWQSRKADMRGPSRSGSH